MVTIAGGAYAIGSPESEPGRFENERRHEVTVSAFAMSRHEVTVEQFLVYAEATRLTISPRPAPETARHPMIRANWYHAVRYAEWLSKETGHTYRLPTEAEWEIAARAGQDSARHFDAGTNQVCRYANVYDRRAQKHGNPGAAIHDCDDGHVRDAPVARYRANAFGLYDMLGNVWEWTCSEYDEQYAGREVQCIDGKAPDLPRVVRGGSWQDEPRWVRTSVRLKMRPRDSDANIGFRVVRELETGETLPNVRDIDPAEELKKPDRSEPTKRASL